MIDTDQILREFVLRLKAESDARHRLDLATAAREAAGVEARSVLAPLLAQLDSMPEEAAAALFGLLPATTAAALRGMAPPPTPTPTPTPTTASPQVRLVGRGPGVTPLGQVPRQARGVVRRFTPEPTPEPLTRHTYTTATRPSRSRTPGGEVERWYRSAYYVSWGRETGEGTLLAYIDERGAKRVGIWLTEEERRAACAASARAIGSPPKEADSTEADSSGLDAPR